MNDRTHLTECVTIEPTPQQDSGFVEVRDPGGRLLFRYDPRRHLVRIVTKTFRGERYEHTVDLLQYQG